jgi:predicted kinase
MSAGKSTLARKLAEQHNAILICEDIWLQQLYPANVPAQRAWFRELIAASGAEHVMHVVDTGHGRCIEQLQQRNREQPPGSMPMSVEQFEAISALFVPPAEDEGFQIRIHR